MVRTRRSISRAAQRVAIAKPGKDPLAPTATTSPASRPASWKYRTINAAKFGFNTLRFASRLPSVVVRGVHSGPISPVPFGSRSASIGIPSAMSASLRIASARSMRRAALSATSAKAQLTVVRVALRAAKPMQAAAQAATTCQGGRRERIGLTRFPGIRAGPGRGSTAPGRRLEESTRSSSVCPA